MFINLLAVLTSQSIYYGCSTWKTFWEEIFTGEEKFTPVNIKNCGHRNVRKHKEIKDSDKYITLEISFKFVSLKKMRITSSEPKYYLRRSRKGLITSLVLKSKADPKK